ncbi:MAG TPA: DUF5063 domain-containing protein [Candidatus Acidoferrales bacterium]|nr:DUF5063 domain-containing protein [Candidatus Acidoferrales bacterium]
MSNPVQDFAALARKYCEWVDAEPGWGSDDIATAHELLVKLLAAGIELPQGKPTGAAEAAKENVRELMERMKKRFADLPVQDYWEINDPVAAANEEEKRKPTALYLWEVLMDIYIELKAGLYFYDQQLEGDACVQWRVSFDTHWERLTLSALRAVYAETW